MDDIYSIVYEGEKGIKDGYLINIEIKYNGTIADSILSKQKFNIGDKNYFAGEPDIIHINDDVIAIVFRSGSQSGTPHEGHLITFRSGNFEDPYIPPNFKGIYREECYGIYLNRTHVSGFINNIIISEEINESTTEWNHIVLIYNDIENMIKLYLNANLINTTIYNQPLNSDFNKDFIIGKSFFGYIDEVQIRERAFTSSEVQIHYNNPGII